MKNLRFISFAMLLLLMGGMVTISSCNKDDDDSPSKTKTISGKKFYVKSMNVNPGVTTPIGIITDLYSFMPDCVKDDFMTFNENGTVVDDEGATKCEPTDPQTESGTWEFMTDETQLRMTYDDVAQVFDIEALTDTSLKLSYTDTEDFGDGEKVYQIVIEFEVR
ncbi:MAG: hypothetical protein EOM83_13910 [Clostridia bacterium]|nr:hypothetical protein [Clostridia bacterium]